MRINPVYLVFLLNLLFGGAFLVLFGATLTVYGLIIINLIVISICAVILKPDFNQSKLDLPEDIPVHLLDLPEEKPLLQETRQDNQMDDVKRWLLSSG